LSPIGPLKKTENLNTLKVCQALKNFIIRFRRVFITIVFLLQAVLSNYLAFYIRFESVPSGVYLSKFLAYLPLLLVIRLVFYLQSGLYKGLWCYAGISDLMKIVNSTTFGSAIFLMTVRYVIGDVEYPRSVYFSIGCSSSSSREVTGFLSGSSGSICTRSPCRREY